MIYLILVSFIWAFSFGIIKTELQGINASVVSSIRLGLSFLVLLPFLRIKNLSLKNAISLTALGTIQYGIMYVTYITAYRYLQAYQVALLTIFTPIYVVLANDVITRNFNINYWAGAFLATLGAGLILFDNKGINALAIGIVLMQISNFSFALGQIFYKKIMGRLGNVKDSQIFALLFLGGALITALFALFSVNPATVKIRPGQWIALIYLGIIASGVGFFLWNYGLRKVNAGTLSILNNLKIPLAIFVSIFLFKEKADILKLISGLGIILSAFYLTNKPGFFPKNGRELKRKEQNF